MLTLVLAAIDIFGSQDFKWLYLLTILLDLSQLQFRWILMKLPKEEKGNE